MGKLRNFQFLRNNEINSFADYVKARAAATDAFNGLTLQDGEIALYSYQLTTTGDTVHTLLGIKRTDGIEILGNYDELTAEYQSYVNTQIQALDSEVTSDDTDESNGVSVTVTQLDGKITAVSVVAPSLSDAIEALDVNPFYLTELNGTTLQRYQISEVDGKIVKGQNADTVLTFASAPTADNKVVTQAEITALNADKTSAEGTNVRVQVIEQAGVITGVNVTDNSVNATDVTNAINALNANESGTNTRQDITVGVVETAGKITQVTVTDTLAEVAHTGAAADVTVAAGIEGLEATNVQSALAELAGDIADLDAAQLSAGKGIDIVTSTVDGVTTNSINADLKLSIANETTGEGESAVTTTYLYIKDSEGNEISKLDASEFVKDGFLQSVVLDEEEGELVFTWNTDAEGAGEQNQVTRIAISDLCDVYTAKENDWIQLNGFEFSHKLSGVILEAEGVPTPESLTVGLTPNTDTVVDEATESVTFKVPTITVDKAGHVTSASDKQITITLPESIASAVQTVTSTETVNTTNKFVAVHATRAEGSNDVVLTSEVKTQAVADAAANNDGLATAADVKQFVLDNSASVIATDDETTVAKSTTQPYTYTVGLADVTRTDNPIVEGETYTNSFADSITTFEYVKAIRTDRKGRVTGVDTVTMTEFFDAGTY